jgi:hypothetical protein
LHGQVVTIDVALAERAAPVRANVVERVELPVNIEKRDGATVNLNYHALTRRQIRFIRYLDEL